MRPYQAALAWTRAVAARFSTCTSQDTGAMLSRQQQVLIHPRRNRAVLLGAAGCILLAGCATSQRETAARPVKAESRLRVAQAAETSGNRDMAIAMYKAAAEAAPANNVVQRDAAEGLARSGKLEDAAILLNTRLKASPRDADLRRALGAVELMAGHPTEALQALTDVLAERADDVRAMTNKAVALDILGRHPDAQALYRQAQARAPGDVAIANNLALSLMLSGQLQEARAVLGSLRGDTAAPERAKVNLGLLDAASGQMELAHGALVDHVLPEDLPILTEAVRLGGAGPKS